MIDGVMTKQLKVIPDERGRLMECLRNDDELFVKFGQFYMTTTFPGVVKGWHLHDAQCDNIVCVKGMIKLVLFDGRGAAGEAARRASRRPRPARSTSSSSASTTRCWCACRPASGTAGSASAPRRRTSSTRRPRSTSTTTRTRASCRTTRPRSPTTGASSCARRGRRSHAALVRHRRRRPAGDGLRPHPRRARSSSAARRRSTSATPRPSAPPSTASRPTSSCTPPRTPTSTAPRPTRRPPRPSTCWARATWSQAVRGTHTAARLLQHRLRVRRRQGRAVRGERRHQPAQRLRPHQARRRARRSSAGCTASSCAPRGCSARPATTS